MAAPTNSLNTVTPLKIAKSRNQNSLSLLILISRVLSVNQVAGVYLKLGVEHILTGIDHLLFVLALLLITCGSWKLVKTVSAFTLSHNITLTAATLGFVHVPQRPVEAF